MVDLFGFGLLHSLGLSVIVAATVSFLAATIVNFMLSARWVFGVTTTPWLFARVLGGALGGLATNVTITVIGMSRMRLSWTVAKIIGISAALFLNFYINVSIVFRR